MNRDESTSHPLDTHAPVLSKSQKAVLWRKIEAALPDAAVPSPYLFSFVKIRPMAPLALVVAVLLGVGGTAAASEHSRPGDLLFPVDRALEDVRLALARNDNARAELQIKFAEERLAELRSILAEADDFGRNGESETNSNTNDDSVSEDSNFNFEAEADVFIDTTIVKVEINDRKTTFETDADTRAEVIDVIVDRFDVDRATVEAVLDFEIEDRASRIKERVVESSDVRVSTSLDLLDELLSQLSEKDRDRILAATIDQFGTERNESRSNRNDENNGEEQRIEIRDGENRIRIREKDGESRVEVKGDVSSFSLKNLLDFMADESDDDRDDSDDSRSSSSFEAEADVFTDTTIVKVEINDRKTTFETDADTRAEVIDVIVDRFDVDRATVEAVLDFEIEDRASRVDDSDGNQSDDDNEDSDDDNSEDGDGFDDSDHRVRIEVRVEDGRAEVRMEYDGKRDEFETSYISKTALIAALSARSGLPTGVISENLDLEVRDQ